ncbi:MAG TPA: RodZ domain-containing protein [Terriglobales bacterium]|nr:RodZ domain-containing protein [Terriglobales bacterium]
MPSFGEQLKREREKRSITLDDISVSTKISRRLLRALEEDHFEQLPGGIFNKGFIRAYAKYVGLDEDQIVADYLVASGEEQPAAAPLPEAPARRDEPEVSREQEKAWTIPWGSLAMVLLLAALGLALWRERDRMRQAESASPPEPLPITTPSPATSPTTPASTPASSVPPAAQTFTILVEAREECWISLSSDGKDVFEGTLQAGETKKILAQRQAVVKAGNVGGIAISFNGSKVPIEGKPGQVKAFRFDENGVSTVTSSAPATN